MMGLYTEAVTLALDNNNIDIAKSYANKPENDDLKKKLWLQVFFFNFNETLKNNFKIKRLRFIFSAKEPISSKS